MQTVMHHMEQSSRSCDEPPANAALRSKKNKTAPPCEPSPLATPAMTPRWRSSGLAGRWRIDIDPELGMPFTDPMADSPATQHNIRWPPNKNLLKTLQMVREFRQDNNDTPLVLMGRSINMACRSSLPMPRQLASTVDMPPSTTRRAVRPAQAAGIDFIRLTTPTTDDVRLPTVLMALRVCVLRVGRRCYQGRAPPLWNVEEAVTRLRRHTDLPIIGFGIHTPGPGSSHHTPGERGW